MSSYTIAQIENQVRLRGDYQRSAKFTEAYVQAEIQKAWGELYELIADTWEGWWDKEGTVTTVANQQYRALPTDCWRLQGVDIADGTGWDELDQVGVGDRNKFGSSPGKPEAFRTSSRGLELYPTPNAIYTLRVLYVPTVTPLSSTPTNFQNEWDEYVIESALVRLGEREERDISTHWRRLYDPENGLKARITKGASKRRAAEPEYLQLREFAGTYEEPY